MHASRTEEEKEGETYLKQKQEVGEVRSDKQKQNGV
jgi:hypothetical protein